MQTHFRLLLPLFLCVFTLFLAAENKPDCPPPSPPPGKFSPKHPLLNVLESDAFSAEERSRLKKLSVENPQQFSSEMRNHFRTLRQTKAKQLLALREDYLKAATPAEKEVAMEKIRNAIKLDLERHSQFQKQVLTDTESAIRQMEKRLGEMKKRYERELAEKNNTLEKRTRELVAPEAPKRLVRDAAGEFTKRTGKNKK